MQLSVERGRGCYTQLPGEDTAGHRRDQLVQLPVERGTGVLHTAAGRGYSWPPTESARAAAGRAGRGGYTQLPGEDTAGHRRDQLVQRPVERGTGGYTQLQGEDTAGHRRDQLVQLPVERGTGVVTHSCRERIQLATDGISSCSCRWSGGREGVLHTAAGRGYSWPPTESARAAAGGAGDEGLHTAAGRGYTWPPTGSARAAAGRAGRGGGYTQLPGEDTAGH